MKAKDVVWIVEAFSGSDRWSARECCDTRKLARESAAGWHKVGYTTRISKFVRVPK